MSHNRLAHLTTLEGRRVSLALRNGSRIDDCELVSGGRRNVGTIWVVANGADAFVPLPEVVDLWEVTPAVPFQAA